MHVDHIRLHFESLKTNRSAIAYLDECEACLEERTRAQCDVPALITEIVSNSNLSKEMLRQKLCATRPEIPDGGHMDILLNHALRKLCFINVADRDGVEDFTETYAVSWRADESLEGLMGRLFQKKDMNQAYLTGDTYLCDELNLENARRYGRLQIDLTNSLEDHLRLRVVEGERHLRVFQHADWLGTCIESACLDELLPRELLRETLMTLDLLFNSRNSLAEPLAGTNEGELLRIDEVASIEIQDYPYWGHRLAVLYREIHSPPRTFWRAIRDSRNPLVWWTFCLALVVAVLTLTFGILATILAALQLEASKNSPGLLFLKQSFERLTGRGTVLGEVD